MSETMADMLEEEDLDTGIGEETQDLENTSEQVETKEVEDSSKSITDVILAKSPEHSLDHYQDHPVDFDGEESTWRILRGLEGMLGSLNYALVDIAIGSYQKLTELGGGSEEDTETSTPEIGEQVVESEGNTPDR